MAKFKVKDSGLPLIPAGEYFAIFASYEEKKNLPHGDAIKLNFIISEGDHKDLLLNQLVSARLSVQSNFGKAVAAISGRSLEPGADLDLDEFVSKPCVIVVGTVEASENYGEFSTVVEVKPLPKDKAPF